MFGKYYEFPIPALRSFHRWTVFVCKVEKVEMVPKVPPSTNILWKAFVHRRCWKMFIDFDWLIAWLALFTQIGFQAFC